jgi:hypothetical protein
MQIEDSSLIGIIELDSPAPFDFDTLLNPGSNSVNKKTNRRPRRLSPPAARWSTECRRPPQGTAAAQDAPSVGSSVIALRFPRPDNPTTHTVAADLARLEEDLHSELRRLHCQLDRLRPCGS